ncbi:MAG: hypothetical protein JWP12_3877 [Bacteroidetes bacterium]|nr:hypothetical protein [Bacteroidota bacterium]
MHKLVKKFLSFFFLFLFLFPTVETQFHAYEHRDDLHCNATDKHFHSQEHHCPICDYTATDSNAIADQAIGFSIPSRDFTFQLLIESVHIPDAFQDLPSRAPPIV